MCLSVFVFLVLTLVGAIGRPVAAARSLNNLRARYDHRENAIYVEWESRSYTEFELRYRLNAPADKISPANGESDWQFADAQLLNADDNGKASSQPTSYFSRLNAETFSNNDELFVQVKPSQSSDWGDTLIISIAKRLLDDGGNIAPASGRFSHSESAFEEPELEPPRNFTANVLTANAIRLEWTRSASEALTPGLFYIVDIRQTTANDPNRRPIAKQIKVESDNFLLGDLTAGEHYELTIRSAANANHVSSTAAIVDIGLPREEHMFEVGNLIISSRFKTDGSGTVNLTWETPAAVRGKITAYDVQYAEKLASRPSHWRRVQFDGNSPTVLLHDLRSDTEYLLIIKTRLANGLETESGQFRFHTPRVPANPIERLDVIHSSDTSAVRLQWTLADHVNPSRVAGYELFVSENKEAAEVLWRRVPTVSTAAEALLDDLSPSRVYYAKIKVQMTDGTVVDGPLIYKFTSTDEAGFSNSGRIRRAAQQSFQGSAEKLNELLFGDSDDDSRSHAMTTRLRHRWRREFDN